MVKSPTLKIGTRNSDHKHPFRNRSQRANKRESIINHKRQLFTTLSDTNRGFHHHHVTKSSLKTLRNNAPLSEEDFPRFAYQLDLEWNSFRIVAETTQRIRQIVSIEGIAHIEKLIRSGAVPYLMELLDTKEIEKYYTINEQNHCRSKTSISKHQLFQLQANACWIITNIAGGTSEHARYVVELGCVPLFTTLIV